MSTVDEAVQEALKIDGWMNEAELRWLALAASVHNYVVEFGAFKGRSTRALCTIHKQVFAVDSWDGQYTTDGTPAGIVGEGAQRAFAKNLEPAIKAGIVTAAKKYSYECLDLRHYFPIDMVFIDANHDYEAVRHDIMIAHGLLCGRGLICGHDFSNDYPGVQRAVQELVPGFARAPGGDIWYKELSDIPGAPSTSEKKA